MHNFSGRAYECHILSQSDDYSGPTMTNPTIPSELKNEAKKSIVIGCHSIVGTGSLIFPGDRMTEGAAVGVMSMVRRDA